MHHKCYGDLFSAEGDQLYRCSYDGAVSSEISNGDACPSCGRIVDAVDRGALVVTTQVKRYAMLPDGREAILSATRTTSA